MDIFQFSPSFLLFMIKLWSQIQTDEKHIDHTASGRENKAITIIIALFSGEVRV